MPPHKVIASEEEDSQSSEAPPLKKHKSSAAVSTLVPTTLYDKLKQMPAQSSVSCQV